jgi:hypothetical protein
VRRLALVLALAALLGGSACSYYGDEQACLSRYPDQRPCLRQSGGDYDCEGGTGDGPNYIDGPVKVRHDVSPEDPFGLDRDQDGVGSEPCRPSSRLRRQRPPGAIP